MSLSAKVSQVNKGKKDLSDTLAFVSPLLSLFLTLVAFLDLYLTLWVVFFVSPTQTHTHSVLFSNSSAIYREYVFPKSFSVQCLKVSLSLWA